MDNVTRKRGANDTGVGVSPGSSRRGLFCSSRKEPFNAPAENISLWKRNQLIWLSWR